MTSSRVSLRMPPELIESARAAQYANRETFGGRSAQTRLINNTNQKIERAQRESPILRPDRGGMLPDAADRWMPRPRQRRRLTDSVDVAVGWMLSESTLQTAYIDNFQVISDTSAGRWERNGHSSVNNNKRIYIGSGNGSKWELVELAANYQSSSRYVRYGWFPGAPKPVNFDEHSYSAYRLDCVTLPIGKGKMLLLIALRKLSAEYRFSYNWEMDTLLDYSETYEITLEKCVACNITANSVNVQNLPSTPAFMNIVGEDITIPAFQFTTGNFTASSIVQRPGYHDFDAMIYHTYWSYNYRSGIGSQPYASTSASYQQLQNTDVQLTPAQAQAAYRAYAGRDIPVLGYNRSTALAPSPLTEKGIFGVRVGANVVTGGGGTALKNARWQQPAANAYLPSVVSSHKTLFAFRVDPNTELNTLNNTRLDQLIAYDYHGGTYCRDQLRSLGIYL